MVTAEDRGCPRGFLCIMCTQLKGNLSAGRATAGVNPAYAQLIQLWHSE